MPTKILFVEDNDLNRDMMSKRLRRKGHTVILAETGIEGVAKAISEQPDIILMDMSLPELDGWQATRKLKKNEQTKHIPIIALTAHAIPGDREKCLDAGCDDYDTKPVDFKGLLEKIEIKLKKDDH